MIKLTIQDSSDVMELDTDLQMPISLTPLIAETDVQTIDGNITTYYSSTKRQYTFSVAWMDAEAYSKLQGFRDRQYSTMKYPRITIAGAQNLDIVEMTAKLSLNAQNVTDRCGVVENIELTIRESKQLP